MNWILIILGSLFLILLWLTFSVIALYLCDKYKKACNSDIDIINPLVIQRTVKIILAIIIASISVFLAIQDKAIYISLLIGNLVVFSSMLGALVMYLKKRAELFIKRRGV